MAEHEPEKFCRGCDYSLRGLTVTRCPECGRPFDPSDKATYATEPDTPELALFLRQPPGVTLYVLCGLSLLFSLAGHLLAGHFGNLSFRIVAFGLWIIAFMTYTICVLILFLTRISYAWFRPREEYPGLFAGSGRQWMGVSLLLVVALLVLLR